MWAITQIYHRRNATISTLAAGNRNRLILSHFTAERLLANFFGMAILKMKKTFSTIESLYTLKLSFRKGTWGQTSIETYRVRKWRRKKTYVHTNGVEFFL